MPTSFYTSSLERDGSERQPSRSLSVPVVPGRHDTRTHKRLIESPESSQPTTDQETRDMRRMWATAGLIALLSSAVCIKAFYSPSGSQEIPTQVPGCKVINVSETADNTVHIQLDHPADNKRVWIGNFRGVMEAQAIPGTASYSLNTAGYLHHDIIGVYIDSEMCDSRFDLGSVHPGDEEIFVK
jgi:hypothetical protein